MKAEKEELALRVIQCSGSVCRVLASIPHCSWFLPNAIFDYVHPYVHGFFGCFGQKPLPTSLTIEVCNHVQACCPARAYCS